MSNQSTEKEMIRDAEWTTCNCGKGKGYLTYCTLETIITRSDQFLKVAQCPECRSIQHVYSFEDSIESVVENE